MASTKTVALWRFDETATEVQPRDAAGHVADLVAPFGFALPDVDTGILGRARRWPETTSALIGTEAVADSTRLTRDLTIEAVVKILLDGTYTGTFVLAQRGDGSGAAAERILYSLQLVVSAGPVVKLQLAWQKASGAGATVPALAFSVPAGWLYLAATRHWISATSVEVSYFVNGRLLGTVTSSDGDIQDGAGGTILVGFDGTHGLPGDGTDAGDSYIDQVRISGEARSAEEISWTHDAMFSYGALGYDLVRGLWPPGRSIATDPGSAVQRELQVIGDGLGHGWALAGQLAADFLPDRAWSSLARWETVTGLAPGPSETYTTRRTRVLTYLRKVHGFNRDQVREALKDVLGLSDAALAAIIEVSNHLDDTFATAIAADWFKEVNAGTIAADGAGGADLTLGAAAAAWTASARTAVSMRRTIRTTKACEIILGVQSYTFAQANDEIGLFIYNAPWRASLRFGVFRDNATAKLALTTIVAGVLTQTLYGAAPATPCWLRYLDLGDTGTASLYYSTTSVDGPWTLVAAGVTTIAGAAWTGPLLLSDVGNVTVKVREFKIWTPHTRDVFRWYVYRDPALAGSADAVGAELALAKMRPAHTIGHACERRAIRCDDARSLTDRDPLEEA